MKGTSGKMALVFKQGVVKDSEDGSVDRKVRDLS